ncbi:hypothetical protein FACS1894184_08470 [Clostridia bacterium]|nr:hypothetical protein FACS1894184_08470 [Clostridia bacterium]
MKKLLTATLLLALLLFSIPARADYKESEAFNVAQHFVTEALEARGCSKLRWAIVDYHMNKNGSRYALYSDVKYQDAKFKDQRDYFVVVFDETDDGVELYMMVIGAETFLGDGFERDGVAE